MSVKTEAPRTWIAWQHEHGEKIQTRVAAILKAEGLLDSYTYVDLKAVCDVLACGLSAYHLSVAKHALRSLHAQPQRGQS